MRQWGTRHRKALDEGRAADAAGPRSIRVIALPLLLATGCVASASVDKPAAPPAHAGLMSEVPMTAGPMTAGWGAAFQGERPAPYLAPADLPDGLALVPPPPAAGSPAQARDLDGAQRAIARRGSARWTLATSDAELFTPTATGTMSCAAGRRIDASSTPATFRLLTRAAIDFANSTASAKDHYKRPRPFMENGEPTCTPDAERHLRHNGSYPSGHSAIGYGWGLLLAALVPDRTTALVARGRAFGDSRRVCNVHWLSDVEEGRITATAAFVRLQASADFQADLETARRELASLPPIAASRDCAAEAAALSGE